MRSPGFITRSKIVGGRAGSLLLLCLLLIACSVNTVGQRLAIIDPIRTEQSERVAEKLAEGLSRSGSVVDRSLSASAFSSFDLENPYNLSTDESRRIGAAIGCNAFLIIKTETLRRTSSERPAYFESYTAVFLVGAKQGHLIWWRLTNRQSPTAAESERKILEQLDSTAGDISQNWQQWLDRDNSTEPDPGYPEIPDEGSTEAKNFRAPLPYLRIKPEYTEQAFLYGAKGTVEIAVDLDEKGNIVRTEIERWAGFGLDEAVTDVVRKMNWRPAERAGKALPVRFLLRYNFKKIEKE
jgi:TonB family protein